MTKKQEVFEEIVKRLSGRRVHLDSGRVYHVQFNPPNVEGRDDVTGEELIQRVDDQEDTVRNRLALYHEQTKPLVDFYTELMETGNTVKLININGVASVEEIRAEVSAALG